MYKTLLLIMAGLSLISCSTSYKELSKIQGNKELNFQNYLHNEYKNKAIFEAEKMHDWNSAKLYSEKALLSMKIENIYPEKISYWNLPKEKIKDINIAHKNLMTIYDDAKISDPYNLAKAIVSLDCWGEQQEENWQIWDINKCKEDFLKSMHLIYENLQKNKNKKTLSTNKKESSNVDATIVTKNKNDKLMQIVYFDFDKSNLSNVSKDKIKLFLKKNLENINEFLVLGHTDTKGSKNYNLSLSIKRAEVVKKILIANGVDETKIKIMGMGEEFLAILTPDDTEQPINRRVEIKKTN